MRGRAAIEAGRRSEARSAMGGQRGGVVRVQLGYIFHGDGRGDVDDRMDGEAGKNERRKERRREEEWGNRNPQFE